MWPDHHPVGPISGEPIEPAERSRRRRWYPGMPCPNPRQKRYHLNPIAPSWLKRDMQSVGRTCSVAGCWKPVLRGGTLCTRHDHCRKVFGHPLATGHIKRRLVARFVALAERYLKWLDKHAEEHPEAHRQVALARHWLRTKMAVNERYATLWFRAGQDDPEDRASAGQPVPPWRHAGSGPLDGCGHVRIRGRLSGRVLL